MNLPFDEAGAVSAPGPGADLPPSGDAQATAAFRARRVGSWWGSGRAVWVLALVAVVSLGLGFGLGRLVRSPGELAAEGAVPPEGLITAKVEARVITSTVTARADIVFSDPVQINPSVPEGVGAPVVTGQVPEVGAVVEAGDVILEVSGSPVFVLPGVFPGYRSMGPGLSGPDVLQLREALAALGLNVGDAASKTYDLALANAVKALYENAGYPAPGSEDASLAAAVRDARDGLTDAKDARDQAEKAVVAADKAVVEAGRADPDQDAEAAAEAKEQAEEVAEEARSGLAQAERSVTRAEEGLADAERAAWTVMPLSAVVFVSDLPRRVDSVGVQVGSDLSSLSGGGTDPVTGVESSGSAVVLSGADIEVTALVGLDEAALLQVGGPAVLAVGEADVTGEIAEVCAEAAEGSAAGGSAARDAGAGQCEVAITVADLGGADAASLVGNVLVTMVVGTTSADSLVVPVAAVSADTAGNARIEVVVGELAHDQAAAAQATRVVSITPGLTAEGMVEVVDADYELKAGDLVVVGRGASSAGATATADAASARQN